MVFGVRVLLWRGSNFIKGVLNIFDICLNLISSFIGLIPIILSSQTSQNMRNDTKYTPIGLLVRDFQPLNRKSES